MKDRLANVERIVTDDSHRLTQEIEALRCNKGLNMSESLRRHPQGRDRLHRRRHPVIFIFGQATMKRISSIAKKGGRSRRGQTAEKAAQYAAHNERLEQRVRVLERIVTDKGIDIAEDIEQLRDRPLN